MWVCFSQQRGIRREKGGKEWGTEEGAGRRSGPHLLYGWLKVEVTGLFQVQPDHGHAGHGLHGLRHAPAPRPPPKLSQLQAQPRTPPLHAGSHLSRGDEKNAPTACWERLSPPV